MKKQTVKNLGKIILTLKETEDWLHLREIARRTNIHPQMVSYLIDRYLNKVTEIQNLTEYGLKVKLIKIKNKNTTLQDVIRYIEAVKRVNQ